MATYRKQAVRLITGDKELDAKLESLKVGAANKIARPAMMKAARLLLKKIKADVPANYKNLKRAMGMAVDQKGGRFKDEQRAKVGAAVGKASKSEVKRSGRNKGGVGISGSNIHWLLLGTGPRTTKAGKSTGQMPKSLDGLIKNATLSARSEALAVMRTDAMTRLDQLAKKKA